MSEFREQAKALAARPYTLRVLHDNSTDGEPLYVALNPELEGCLAQGETIREATTNLSVFRIDYIEHLLAHDLPVPYPETMVTKTSSSPGVTLYWKKPELQSDPKMMFEIRTYL
jgi:predicted RNase H-like HicB family nuclease